jgi:hypothetical protein
VRLIEIVEYPRQLKGITNDIIGLKGGIGRLNEGGEFAQLLNQSPFSFLFEQVKMGGRKGR